MPRRPTLASHLLAALCLTLPLTALAQISPADLAAAQERAQREAERVFSVIRFHTIRSKPAAEAGTSKPRRLTPVTAPATPAARANRPAAAAPVEPAVATQGAEPAAPRPTLADASTPTPLAPQTAPSAWQAPPTAAPSEGPATMPAAPVETDAGGEEPDEPEEAPLTLQHFVPPVLPPAVQATLGAGSRHVRVRLTVRPDGSVSGAEAAAGVPRRLARPATEAILQWQFAPLPQARTADVDIAFRSD
ncbi:energy transducer TonB [Roseateles sp. DC23W]|uniref:Energy transducer TonB n=1 Tax=Pelomonas dachongensis TaxID=3299029 RepID=A0ABW7EJ23_9BURK